MNVSTTPREIKPRKPSFPFDQVPRHWFFGSPFATHMANALNLLFPLGERFFVRSVRHHLDRITDPELREQVKGFIAQEVRHGMEHEKFFDVLEAQGFEIQPFLKWYEHWAFEVIEKLSPPALNLSVTVALEHFTAMFAERALTRDLLSDNAHPVMRDLLLWHAAEEIEHKAVAFDVLRAVNPSYALRIGGAATAATFFVGFWIIGAVTLMRQEPKGTGEKIWTDIKHSRDNNVLANGEFAAAFVDYLRRDFHPSQNDNYALAETYLSQKKYA